jgi:hypothetical protein
MITGIKVKLLIVLVLAAPCLAEEGSIQQLFQRILTQSSNRALPAPDELFTTVNENTVGGLSVQEINALLPLARQCLQSSQPEVRQDGLILLLAVGTRPDSAKLLEPYIDDLGVLLSGPEGAISLRHGALYVLGSTKPNILPKALAYLNAHLQESRNSNEETLTIAASLLEASPNDAATVHKTLTVVGLRADPGLTSGVIRQLGLIKSRNREALAFLGASLNHADTHVRESAVDAVSRLDHDIRSQFAVPLARIASDPNESDYARARARAALQQQ